jgi:hypothetical protein
MKAGKPDRIKRGGILITIRQYREADSKIVGILIADTYRKFNTNP